MQHLPVGARFAQFLIEEPLADFFTRHRADGASWDVVARALWTATDQQIDVTGVTVQKWAELVSLANRASEGAA